MGIGFGAIPYTYSRRARGVCTTLGWKTTSDSTAEALEVNVGLVVPLQLWPRERLGLEAGLQVGRSGVGVVSVVVVASGPPGGLHVVQHLNRACGHASMGEGGNGVRGNNRCLVLRMAFSAPASGLRGAAGYSSDASVFRVIPADHDSLPQRSNRGSAVRFFAVMA